MKNKKHSIILKVPAPRDPMVAMLHARGGASGRSITIDARPKVVADKRRKLREREDGVARAALRAGRWD